MAVYHLHIIPLITSENFVWDLLESLTCIFSTKERECFRQHPVLQGDLPVEGLPLTWVQGLVFPSKSYKIRHTVKPGTGYSTLGQYTGVALTFSLTLNINQIHRVFSLSPTTRRSVHWYHYLQQYLLLGDPSLLPQTSTPRIIPDRELSRHVYVCQSFSTWPFLLTLPHRSLSPPVDSLTPQSLWSSSYSFSLPQTVGRWLWSMYLS